MDKAERHAEAEAVLKRYQEQEVPFVLFLRTYLLPISFQRSTYEARPFFLQDFISDNVQHGIGVISVRGTFWLAETQENPIMARESDDEQFQSVLEARCPALIVSDTEWKPKVEWLIKNAAIIVCEAYFPTEGFCWELEQCLALGRQHDTIVLAPDPNDDRFLQGAQLKAFWNKLRAFNRLAFVDEIANFNLLPSMGAVSHPSSTDLFLRTYIKALGETASANFPPELISMFSFRSEYVGGIMGFTSLASGYVTKNEHSRALIYYESAVSIGMYISEMKDGRQFQGEREAFIQATIGAARCWNRAGDNTIAKNRLEAAEAAATVGEIINFAPDIEELRNKISAGVK